MATLHTLNKLPDEALLNELNLAVTETDSLVLIEEAVYLARLDAGHRFNLKTIYMLDADAQARGVSEPYSSTIKPIGYDEWVQLSACHDRCISWY